MDDPILDDEKIITDAVELGESAKKKIATDPDAVRKIVAGQVPVEDWITVYPDKKVNLAFAKHQEALQEAARKVPAPLDNESDKDYAKRTADFKAKVEALEAEGEAVRQAVKDSGITFHMVGLGKKALKRLRAEVRAKYPLPTEGKDDPEIAEIRDEEYQNRVVAAHLAKDGYTFEDVEGWRDAWPNRAFGQLWATALKLSITDDYLTGAVDVDF